MVSFAKTAFYVGMLSSGAVAWSSVGPSDRRGFLQSASRAAGVIGTVGVCGGEIFVESAQAATGASKKNNNVYQPLPGSLSKSNIIVITGASGGLGLESAEAFSTGRGHSRFDNTHCRKRRNSKESSTRIHYRRDM